MSNPLERSIRSAVRANSEIGNLFAKVGTSDHPRGVILSAYRNAHRSMLTALTEPQPLFGAREVMRELKQTVLTETKPIFQQAEQFGIDEAKRQLGYYGIEVQSFGAMGLSSQTDNAINVLSEYLDSQLVSIETLILAGLDPTLITGDEDRRGILRPGSILGTAIFWILALLWDSFSDLVKQYKQDDMSKQAIAALDSRTTDCCLRVHGQIQPFDKPFQLTGTPRYADKLDWAPFHDYCRTSIVLYSPEFDFGLTDQMREAADYVLAERAAGRVFDQHPADAFIKKP